MSRHYNTQHPDRGRSHYPERLSNRGLTKTPTMPTLEYLHNKQTSVYWLAAHPAIVANLEEWASK